MINNERELEDYICEHQDEFIGMLKESFDAENIEFVGRQIRIGNDNIADLVYIMYSPIDEAIRELIIVELKYRKLMCKDLAQITRYISIIQEKDEFLNFENVYGCFVSFGCSDEMMDICKLEEKIKFISLKCSFEFTQENYSYTDEYLNGLQLDARLKKYMPNTYME